MLRMAGRKMMVSWGGARFGEQSRDISLIYFVEISVDSTENLGEISSFPDVSKRFRFKTRTDSRTVIKIHDGHGRMNKRTVG